MRGKNWHMAIFILIYLSVYCMFSLSASVGISLLTELIHPTPPRHWNSGYPRWGQIREPHVSGGVCELPVGFRSREEDVIWQLPCAKELVKKHPGIKLRTEWRAARKQTAAGGNGREHPCGAGVPRPRAAASPGWAAGHESMGTWWQSHWRPREGAVVWVHRLPVVPLVTAYLIHLGFLKYLVSVSTTRFVVLIIYFFSLSSLHFFHLPDGILYPLTQKIIS